MTGRTAGYVEAAAGLYLFTPVDEEAALQRVFVPRCAYSHCEFGPSAEEIAARLWIGSPAELLDAIERQERMPVLPIGQSLLALGLLTQAQLDRELAKPVGDRPLGEALVAAGLISHTDLHTAIAHKMGYPMVDLTRFPVDPAAVAKVPKDIAAAPPHVAADDRPGTPDRRRGQAVPRHRAALAAPLLADTPSFRCSPRHADHCHAGQVVARCVVAAC